MKYTSDADMLAYVDDDQDYGLEPDGRLLLHREPRVGRGKAMNLLCEWHPDYDAYILVADDCVFTKPSWDDELCAAIDAWGDGIGVVNVARETHRNFVNFPAVSGKWIKTLGWFNVPSLERYCQDTALQAMSDALGRTTYLPENIMRHKGMVVENQPEKIAADAIAFLWFMALEFKSCLDKLKAVMH